MADRHVVMVVEDDVEMNELQQEMLAVHGMDAIPAYTGREALEINQQSKPDAVLLDIMLPEMDGFETCRRLRSMNHRKLPIVMLTALDADDCRQRGYKVGADAYFTKPFDPDQVIQTLQMLIEHAGQNGDSEK